MAIHPYPTQLVRHWQTPDGTTIIIRPIRPEDAEIEQTFVRNLSPEVKRFRFMQGLRELTPEMLVRFTQVDYDREMALIAVVLDNGKEKEIAVARYAENTDGETCEFAIVVADEWQGRGIGSEIMLDLMGAARHRGIRLMEGRVLADNTHMLELVKFLGFDAVKNPEDPGIYDVSKRLDAG